MPSVPMPVFPAFATAAAPRRRGPRRARSGALTLLAVIALGAQPLAPAMNAVGPAHAQRLPDLGDESQSMLAPAQERKLGESTMRQIRAQGGYMDDPEVNDYLNELGHRLVAAVLDSPQEFEFFAVP